MISIKIIDKLTKLLAEMPAEWEGRRAILEMKNAGYPHWKQMEWIGFLFSVSLRYKIIVNNGNTGSKIWTSGI